jgi:hypothetical protein
MACEEHEHGRDPDNLRIDGYSDEQIGYHAYLIIDAGLARGFDVSDSCSPSPEWHITCLTWDGHEFLEASRNEGLWTKAKHAAGSTGGMALGVLKSVLIDLATHAAKKAAGLP